MSIAVVCKILAPHFEQAPGEIGSFSSCIRRLTRIEGFEASLPNYINYIHSVQVLDYNSCRFTFETRIRVRRRLWQDQSAVLQPRLQDQVNRLGDFDAVIHNAGIGYREPKLVKTVDGLPQLFAVNTLAPYILTALLTMPKRLVYLSSGMHYGAGSHLDDMLWEKRRWSGSQAYAETKFQDVLLAFAVAGLFLGVKSNSLEPGWVRTKMGGAGAPDDIDKAHRTQVWLATSEEPDATVSGRYFFHQKLRDPDPATMDVELQSLLLDLCARFQGRPFPNRNLLQLLRLTKGKLIELGE
jgi:NAD(P)-dependent dehydrogenase (short-subunit alcohol dehydrogenase family)